MTPRELAAAIRRGHEMIGERKSVFLSNNCGCALGAVMKTVLAPRPELQGPPLESQP